jgi:ribosomal protein L22
MAGKKRSDADEQRDEQLEHEPATEVEDAAVEEQTAGDASDEDANAEERTADDASDEDANAEEQAGDASDLDADADAEAEEDEQEAKPRRRRRSSAPVADGEEAEQEAKPTRRRRSSAPVADVDEEPLDEEVEREPDSYEYDEGSVRVVRAQARYVRTSARKARLVCDHLRGKSVDEARAILAFNPRGVSRDWSKVLESAIANAENNHELIAEDLVVYQAFADEGPTIKRFQPRARGRANPIRKRTSHLTITLVSEWR